MNYSIATIPLFQELEKSRNIFLAGMGGGFDIYSGIPLYFALKAMGKNVILGNFSFTWLDETNAEKVFPFCYNVESSHKDLSGRAYFPEQILQQWFEEQGESPILYAFERTGAKPLTEAYQFIKEKHNIDTLLLVDGGTDSLMFGDEDGLGTPQEDMCSMAAAVGSGISNQYLASIGFGIDHFHGVSHFRFLENVATLTKESGYLGLFQLTKEMTEAEKYMDAVDFSNKNMSSRPSIVANSIKSALEGEYGDYHATPRTQGSKLWINPLMSIYWCFNLQALAKKVHYLDRVKDTLTMGEFNRELSIYRDSLEKVRPPIQLPI